MLTLGSHAKMRPGLEVDSDQIERVAAGLDRLALLAENPNTLGGKKVRDRGLGVGPRLMVP